jgi:hypothetical protein
MSDVRLLGRRRGTEDIGGEEGDGQEKAEVHT